MVISRWRKGVVVCVGALSLLDTFLMLYIFLFGQAAVRVGGVVLGIGNAKLTCSRLPAPFFALLVLLLLAAAVRRPDPIERLARWFGAHRATILRASIVLGLAAVPRLWDLTGHSLSPDELLWSNSGRALVFNVRAREFMKATSALGHPGIVPAAMIGAGDTYLGKGTSPFSFEILDPIAAWRLPIAAAGIATGLLLYLLGRLVLGEKIAFLAAILLSLYPPHIASSRVAMLDAVLTLFFLLTLLCYVISAERGSLGWKLSSGVFFGLALLTKTPASLLPVMIAAWKGGARLLDRRGKLRFWEAGDLAWLGVGLTIYFTIFTRLWLDPRELPWGQFVKEMPGAETLIGTINAVGSLPWPAIAAGFLGAAAALRLLREGNARSLIRGALLVLASILFIRVFRKPMVNEVLHYAAISHFADAGHLKYWMGRVVVAPPRWFYAFMLCIRTPPVMLLLLAAGIVRSCDDLWRRRDAGGPLLICLLTPLLFIAAMSGGAKMGFRYIDPAIPFLCVIAAVGFAAVVDALAAFAGRRGVRITWKTAAALTGTVVAACLVAPLARIAPAYDLYSNVFIGGMPGAARNLSIGFGVGSKEAAEYLSRHLREGDAVYALGISGELDYYLKRMMPRGGPGMRVNTAYPPDVDWLVVPLSYRVRFAETDCLLKEYPFRRVYSVRRHGVDFADIYRLERPPGERRESAERTRGVR
ncbi:MAG: glycosyltransferase family 39 protein [Chlamydiota bacterium]